MIPFCSRTGTNLCAYIFEQNSGTLTTLRGAAEPFTTRENDTDDVFTPIRTQTGYVRVIDEIGGTLMQQIMPANNTQKKVELWSGTYKAVTANVGSLPATTYTYGGKKFLGVDASHNWRDDEQEVKFIEVS